MNCSAFGLPDSLATTVAESLSRLIRSQRSNEPALSRLLQTVTDMGFNHRHLIGELARLIQSNLKVCLAVVSCPDRRQH